MVFMNKICIDIDGTITDPYHFIPYLNELTGKKITSKEYISTDWNLVYGTEFGWIYDNFDEDFSYIYQEAKLLPSVNKTIYKLIENGYEVFFVTARSNVIHEITKKWLVDVGLGDIKLYSLGENNEKAYLAKSLNSNIFIEDDPENAKKLLCNDIKVILKNANYNKELCGDNMVRFDNWNEVFNIVQSEL